MCMCMRQQFDPACSLVKLQYGHLVIPAPDGILPPQPPLSRGQWK